MNIVTQFGSEFWSIFLELAPYLILGLSIAGLLDLFVKRSFVERHLGKNNFSSTLKAALVGIPLPLCSCGVIPTGISFKNHGASDGATISFLISTPQTGIDSLLVTYSMMNGPWALFRPLVALVSGVLGGWLGTYISSSEPQTQPQSQSIDNQNNEPSEEVTQQPTFKRFYEYAFVSFLTDISRPLITGIALATCITLFIPDSIFTEYLSSPNLNMLIILVASIPLYVCATGSIPIGAALLVKGLSPGAVLVFLMAGPATNAATITVLWNALGKKTTLLYIGVISFFALLFGWIMNNYLPADWFQLLPMAHGEHHHQLLPNWLQYGSAALLILLLLNVEFKKLRRTFMTTQNKTEGTYKIEGMTCNHCTANVDKALRSVDGVEHVEMSLEHGTAQVVGSATAEQIKSSVEKAGYTFVG